MLPARRRPDRGQSQPLFAMRIVHHLALVIEDHGGALISLESRPIWQTLMIRIAGASERGPRPAHLFLKRVTVGTRTSHGLGFIHVVEHEGNFQRVKRLQLSVVYRSLPREIVHVHER